VVGYQRRQLREGKHALGKLELIDLPLPLRDKGGGRQPCSRGSASVGISGGVPEPVTLG